MTTATDNRFTLLETESNRVGWPIGFKSDLTVHDRRYLKAVPTDAKLVWILRPMGTHLYAAACDNRAEAAYIRKVIQYYSGECRINVFPIDDPEAPKFYSLQNDKLTQISHELAYRLISVRNLD